MDIKKLLKNLKLHESTISMILGAVVIIITGILIINYFDAKRGETISTIETEQTDTLPTSHKIAEGEDLWKIAEKYYGSGYNWVDIAKENKITDPNQISVDEEIDIPNVQPRLAGERTTISPEPTIEIPELIAEETETTREKNVHKVEGGDSLWKIAEKYYGSGYNWVDIARANDLKNAGDIEVGQELALPDTEPKLLAVTSSDEAVQQISDNTYKVEKGDSLWDIAVRAYADGYKWVEIAKVNNLENPNVIHPGNVLNLPR